MGALTTLSFSYTAIEGVAERFFNTLIDWVVALNRPAIISMVNATNNTLYAVYSLTSAAYFGSPDRYVVSGLTLVAGGGTFVATDVYVVSFALNGAQGPTGPTGPAPAISAADREVLYYDASDAIIRGIPKLLYDVSENIITKTHIIPDVSGAYDLGTAEFPFRDLYVSNASVYIDDVRLSKDGSGNLSVSTGIDASGSLKLGIATIIPSTDPSGNPAIRVNGSIIPDQSLTYSLGTADERWKEAYIGPGSLNIAGPLPSSAVGTIGTDANSIIYTETGFATPFINVGPAIASSGAVGGWHVATSGTPATPTFDLTAQQNDTSGNLIGPVYSLIRSPPNHPVSAFSATIINSTITTVSGDKLTTSITTTLVGGAINVIGNLDFTASGNNVTTSAIIRITDPSGGIHDSDRTFYKTSTGTQSLHTLNLAHRYVTTNVGTHTIAIRAFTDTGSSTVNHGHLMVFGNMF
jgi:hypothetical protein